MMAVCVAVIGKDNGPIYFKCRKRPAERGMLGAATGASLLGLGSGTEMTDLQYSYIVSSALDIVEERVQLHHQPFKALGASDAGTPPTATRELYLGALTAQEEYKVYGYMTNTKIKLIIIVEETNIPIRENDIRTMFRKIHAAFCDLMCNPFYIPGTEINSKRFEGVVNSIMVGQ